MVDKIYHFLTLLSLINIGYSIGHFDNNKSTDRQSLLVQVGAGRN